MQLSVATLCANTRWQGIGPCIHGAASSWQLMQGGMQGRHLTLLCESPCLTWYSSPGGSKRLSLAEHPVTKQVTRNSARAVQQRTSAW